MFDTRWRYAARMGWLSFVALLLLSPCVPRAHADDGLNGLWLVREDIPGLFSRQMREQWTVSGGTVQLTCLPPDTCANTGVVNPSTGEFFFGFQVNPIFPCPSLVEGTLAPDGSMFKAAGFISLPTFGHCVTFTIEWVGSRCGNGVLDPGETCDDGNDVNGDGCDACSAVCGDGVPQGLEACDDGNADDHDACKNDCTPNVCGDGVVRTGVEACDPGNVIGGGCLPKSCQFALLPGGGASASDSLQEWSVEPSPPTTTRPGRVNRLVCKDDDPTCDFGSNPNDATCTFHVGMCFNVRGPHRTISASVLRRVDILRPAATARSATDITNRAALEQQLKTIGGRVQGICLRGPSRWKFCTGNSDCDSGAGSGDGVCRRTVTFGQGLAGANRCTTFAAIQVPRPNRGAGMKLLELTAGGDDPTTGQPVPKDHDRLTLICLPP